MSPHRLCGAQRRISARRRQQPRANTFQQPVGEARGAGNLKIRIFPVHQRVPKPTRGLIAAQSCRLCAVSIQDQVALPLLQLQQARQLGRRDGEPAISTRPKCACIIVHALKRPTVAPQPCLFIREIVYVQHKLLFAFSRVPLVARDGSDLPHEQHRHEYRVRPKLLVVVRVDGDMLKPAHLGFWQAVQQPLCTGLTVVTILFPACFLVQKAQCEQRRHRVDVVYDGSVQLGIEPLCQILQIPPFSGEPVVFPDAVQRHSLGPIPDIHIEQDVVVILFVVDDILQYLRAHPV